MRFFILLILTFLSFECFSQEVKKIKVKKEVETQKKNGVCSAAILGHSGGSIPYKTLMKCKKVEIIGCNYKLESFVFSFGDAKTCTHAPVLVKGESMGHWQGDLIRSLNPGEKFAIKNIIASDRISGEKKFLPDIYFIVK